MGKNRQYEEAYTNYTNSINNYNEGSKALYDEAYNKSNQYVGDAGYNRALELGKKGAISASQGAISQGIDSARASGMNKAQASAMGNQSAINTYGNQLNSQQQNAYASGRDATINEYNKANGKSGVLSNTSNLLGQASSSRQAEANNKYNRTWGTIGGVSGIATDVLGTVVSDERLKKYRDISTSFCKKTDEDGTDSILKYKVDINKYKGE